MEWDYVMACLSKFILPVVLVVLFFEYVIRRATRRNKSAYDEYLKKADALNESALKKSHDNQSEMIAILKDIRDLLKTK